MAHTTPQRSPVTAVNDNFDGSAVIDEVFAEAIREVNRKKEYFQNQTEQRIALMTPAKNKKEVEEIEKHITSISRDIKTKLNSMREEFDCAMKAFEEIYKVAKKEFEETKKAHEAAVKKFEKTTGEFEETRTVMQAAHAEMYQGVCDKGAAMIKGLVEAINALETS